MILSRPSLRHIPLLHPLLFALSTFAAAQTYTPAAIVFQGAPAYSAQTLTAVAALTPGQPLKVSDIDAAMQRLTAPGLFADIRYTVDHRALTFVLTPQPAAFLLPAVYSNFVLWQPAELNALVRARVPLFNGSVPNSGNLQQTVQEALVAILHDKGITGQVDAIAASDRIGGPITSLIFSITQPSVQIRQLRIDAVSPATEQRISEVRDAFVSAEYDRYSDSSIRERLNDAYRDLGYLDIETTPISHGTPVIEPKSILVDVSLAVREGSLYRVSRLDLPTTDLFPASAFHNAAQLKPGEPAARILLLATSARVENEFHRRGYLEAKATPAETKDTSAHTVAYTYTVAPGERYLLQSIRALNLNDEQQRDFDKNWKLAPGSPYDGDYVDNFLARSATINSLRGLRRSVKLALDRANHTVDLSIVFAPANVRPQ